MDGWTLGNILLAVTIFSQMLLGIAVVIATFRGPVVATREADRRRADSDRRADKMRVFREVMSRRFDLTDPGYVVALNLIQIEFADDAAVIAALQGYLHAFKPEFSERPDAWETRKKAVVRLLNSLAMNLGYQLDQLDLMEQSYSPQRWADLAEENRVVRQLLVDIAKGKSAFPILALLPDTYLESLGEKKFGIRTTREEKLEG